jgi:hypothetical protein
MINTLVMVGMIERVHISESKKKDKTSATIMVRYGDDRNQTGSAVEFINAALLRVPPFRLPSIRDRLKEGAFVHVIGHIQGMFKHQAGQGVLDAELVVDRIDFVQGLNTVHSAYPKGRGTPPHANGAAADRQEGSADETGAQAILEGVDPAEAGLASSETPEPTAVA